MARQFRWGLLVILLAMAQEGRVSALINPTFTPIHLTRESTVILYGTARPVAEDGVLPFEMAKALNGAAPAEGLRLLVGDELIVQNMRDDIFFEGVESVDAMVFLRQSKKADGTTVQTGALSLDGKWFLLSRGEDGNSWQTTNDDGGTMKGVWDGRTDMLRRCVEYILASPDASVPVTAGAKWGRKRLLGKVEGTVSQVVPVLLASQAGPCLLVASDKGDRLFTFDPEKDVYADITASEKVNAQSVAACFADLDGDGRLDLASANGSRFQVSLQSDSGAFDKALPALALPSSCAGVAGIGLGADGRAGVVASLEGGPVLIAMNAKNELLLKRLGAVPDGLGAARPALVADFDGDLIPDILLAFAEGGLLYKGKPEGAFDAPVKVGDLFSGERNARGYPGDFDADGLLDVFFMGEQGIQTWRNLGGGKFENVNHLGEPDYIAKGRNTGGAVGDLNNDGRQDFVIFYKQGGFHPFFNRGFYTFGFADELDAVKGELAEAGAGQQAGALADFNGDGAQDLVCVLGDGTACILERDPKTGAAMSAQATLAPGPSFAGPVTLTGYDGARCLGAWSLARGEMAFFGRNAPGVVTLKWQFPGGTPQKHEVVIMDGFAGVYIGPEGVVAP